MHVVGSTSQAVNSWAPPRENTCRSSHSAADEFRPGAPQDQEAARGLALVLPCEPQSDLLFPLRPRCPPPGIGLSHTAKPTGNKPTLQRQPPSRSSSVRVVVVWWSSRTTHESHQPAPGEAADGEKKDETPNRVLAQLCSSSSSTLLQPACARTLPPSETRPTTHDPGGRARVPVCGGSPCGGALEGTAVVVPIDT